MARLATYDEGSLDGSPLSDRHNYEVQVINGMSQRVHKIVVHSFTMGDVEDPDLYAAEPLLKWQNSDQGQWVMAHALETPVWHRHQDYHLYGYRYAITAKLMGRDYTYWALKWGSKPNS